MEDITIIPRPKKILYIGFNFNASYFMLGTDVGFQVHQSYPIALKFSRVLNGGIGLVQILNKSNIFCLVGGGESPKYAPNKLLIWDDKKGKEIYEFRFSSFVFNCFIKKKYIFAFCKDSINIINMKTMKIIKEIATKNNPDGIGTISSDIDKYILAWPSFTPGEVEIKDFQDLKINTKSIKIKAHTNELVCIKLNKEGTRLASASVNGTMIRVFNVINKQLIQEFKRGSGYAKIYSINFSDNDNTLSITSDHGKAYIFLINNKDKKKPINSNKEIDKIKKEVEVENQIKINNDDNEEDDENNKEDGENIEKVNNELTNSEVGEAQQKSLMRGVSQIIGLSSIFQKGYLNISFKIPTKKQSAVNFLNGDNNKLIVLDKLGNYTIAQITNNTEAKIIKRDLLI
jgi:WD40 repeat protein